MSEPSCVNIRKVHAREFLGDPKRLGGSKSVLIRADDRSRYNVKFKENGQGIRILVNELVASHVAAKLQVPTAETVIVEVEKAFLDANPILATRYPKPVTQGLHFGSMVVRNTFDNPPAALVSNVTNKGDFPRVVAFDVLTNNGDRRNDGNFLIIRPDHRPQQTHFVSVDHGLCFGHNWSANLPQQIGNWCRSHLTEITNAISGESPFDLPIKDILGISREWLDSLISSVPDEWEVSTEERQALTTFILGQADYVQEILEREHGLFPNWKGRSTV